MKLNLMQSPNNRMYLYIIARSFADGLNSIGKVRTLRSFDYEDENSEYSELLVDISKRLHLLNGHASIHNNLALCLQGLKSFIHMAYIRIIELNADCTEVLDEYPLLISEVEYFLEDRGLKYLSDEDIDGYDS